jgi:ATP-dependent DNA helicase pcrA
MYKSALDNLGDSTFSQKAEVTNTEGVSTVDFYEENMKKYLELVSSKGYNLEELEPIIRSEGRTELFATAGSGKSTSISLILAKDKLFGRLSPGNRGDKVAWVTTFLRKGAEEIKQNVERTVARLGLTSISTNDITFSTLQSEFFELLRLRGFNLTDKTKSDYIRMLDGTSDDGETRNSYNAIFDRLFRKYQLGEDGSNYISLQDRRDLQAIISNYRNCVLSKYEFGEAAETAKRLNLTLSILPLVVETYQELKARYSVMDYDDLMSYVYDYMVVEKEDDPVQTAWVNFYKNRYEYFMLDEAQDMSELQYLVLKPIFENCPRVVIVGDPDQSIYGFRGSNPKVMEWFDKEFQPSKYPLSVSYRCPSNILNPIAKSIAHNSNRYEHSLRSYNEGGSIEAFRFDSVKDMADASLQLIDKYLAEGKTIVVQSRVNFTYSPSSILYATKRQGEFNLLGDVRDLNTARYRKVWNLIELVRGRGLTDIKNNLKVLAPEIKPWDAKRLAERLMNIVQENENVLYSNNYAYFDFIANDCGLKSLATLVDKLRNKFGAEYPGDMRLFRELLAHVLYWGDSANAEVVGTISTLAEECDTVSEFFTAKDFVNNKVREAMRGGTSLLTFATPFGFKGREANINIIFDDSDNVFPYALSSDIGYEEERRIHFVAGTRGDEKTIYLTRSGKVSPFLKEMGIPIKGWVPLDGMVLDGVQLKQEMSLKERMQKAKVEEQLGAFADFDFKL